MFLNVLGFTRFTFDPSAQGLNLIQALNYMERSLASDLLPVNATIDFSWEAKFSAGTVRPENNSFIEQFPGTQPGRELPLFRSIRTTAESCLRHLLPLLWVRIQGSAALLEDKLLMQGSATAFPSADGRAEIWIFVPSKPSWDRAGNRLQRQVCFAPQVEKMFQSYLDRLGRPAYLGRRSRPSFQATVGAYDPADISVTSHDKRPTFELQLDHGSIHYQFHRRSCQRWASKLQRA